MGQTKTTRSISATGLFLLIMMTVGLYSCTRTQKDIIPSADYAPYVNAYGRSHLAKFDHTYRTDPRPTHGGSEQ